MLVKLALWTMVFLAACSPSPPRVLVEWTTATEVNTAGFNLYRGTQPEGPFVKLNTNLIPASTDLLAGGKYKYEDTNVTPGQTYYYTLEDVELGGGKQEHGPIKITAASDWKADYVMVFGAGAFIVALGVLFLRVRRKASRQAS